MLMAGNNDEVYDTKLQRYAALLTIIAIKNSAPVIILLRLTTDGHKVSRGLSATATCFLNCAIAVQGHLWRIYRIL